MCQAQSRAEVGAMAGEEPAGSPGFLGFRTEHFTNMENSRSLHESFHSIPISTLGNKNAV